MDTDSVLTTGVYLGGISIGMTFHETYPRIRNPFENQNDTQSLIITDSYGSELTFFEGILTLIKLSSKNALIEHSFSEVINYLNGLSLEWVFDRDLVFETQLTIRIIKSNVFLLFDFEEDTHGKLRKVILK